MRRAVVNDPENPAGLVLGRWRHDLLHQAVKRFAARFRLATTEELGTVNIERGEVGPSPTSLVLVFHLQGRLGSRRAGGVLATACWDTGLLVGRKHEFIGLPRLSWLDSLREIEEPTGLGRQGGIAEIPSRGAARGGWHLRGASARRCGPTSWRPGRSGRHSEPVPRCSHETEDSPG